MSRKRSLSIYAQDETEFIEILNSQSLTNLNLNQKVKSKFTEKLETSQIDQNDFLGSHLGYEITVKELTSQEKEKMEEEKMLKSLENLNNFYQNNDKNNFFSALSGLCNNTISPSLDRYSKFISNGLKQNKIQRSLSFATLDNFNLDQINYNTDSLFRNSNYSGEMVHQSTKTSSLHSIISQNLELVQKTLKILIVGDTNTGKTYFLNQVMNRKQPSEYQSTTSIEIHKEVFEIAGTKVKVEFWDTNVETLNSPIMKTFYRICNGVILIYDYNNENSFSFIQNQLKMIINSSIKDINVITFCNLKTINKSCLEEHINNNSVKENFSHFSKIQFLNFDKIKFKNIERFLNLSLMKKSNKNSRSHKLNVNSEYKNHLKKENSLGKCAHYQNNDKKNKGSPKNDMYSKDSTITDIEINTQKKCLIF